MRSASQLPVPAGVVPSLSHPRRAAAVLMACLGLAGACAAQVPDKALVERGRYVVRIAGCNDCHTPQYGMRNGDVPEKDWLTGDAVGWYGPWGTTYPTNLRKTVRAMSEQQWLAYAASVKTRPPMPWFALHAMQREDLRAVYHFVQSLGDGGGEIPQGLPPGRKPPPPYLDLHPVLPAGAVPK